MVYFGISVSVVLSFYFSYCDLSDSTPAASVALYSIITAGLLGTTLASGALAVSATNLAAVGAISHRSAGIVGSDASRNLLVKLNNILLLSVLNKRYSSGSPWVKVLRKSRTMFIAHSL